jgi:hypothetical protein
MLYTCIYIYSFLMSVSTAEFYVVTEYSIFTEVYNCIRGCILIHKYLNIQVHVNVYEFINGYIYSIYMDSYIYI